MENLHLTAEFDFSKGKLDLGLSLVQFEEDGTKFIYAPALDITGYGDSFVEAEESFKIVLEEFFKYTMNKGTLNQALKELGWEVKGSRKKPKFKPPIDSDLVTKNPTYTDIVNNKQYSRAVQSFAV